MRAAGLGVVKGRGGRRPGRAGWGKPLSPAVRSPRQAFLLKLVQNLFAEGNDLFREKDHKQALVQYMEGLNVADYAASDQVHLPQELLCKLHVNRAACYFTMVSRAPSPLPPHLPSPRPGRPGSQAGCTSSWLTLPITPWALSPAARELTWSF